MSAESPAHTHETPEQSARAEAVSREQFLAQYARNRDYETGRIPHVEIGELLEEIRRGELWHRGGDSISVKVTHLWDTKGRPQESPSAKYWGVDAVASVTLRTSGYEETAHYTIGPPHVSSGETLAVSKRYEVKVDDGDGGQRLDQARSATALVTDPQEIMALTDLVEDARSAVVSSEEVAN